ncbi:MAG: hypothetical protein PHS37_08435, partial [Candidatus Omnitrophica bacterium]|nr:hypothetical protein [Candidatus Omnitrophota bacterium]
VLSIADFFKGYFGNVGLDRALQELIESGQICVIPHLKKSHAGGAGIYLADKFLVKNGNKTTIERFQQEIMHEILAKCGFPHERCDEIAKVFAGAYSAFRGLVRLTANMPGEFERWNTKLGGTLTDAQVTRLANRLYIDRDPKNRWEQFVSHIDEINEEFRLGLDAGKVRQLAVWLDQNIRTAGFDHRMDNPALVDYNNDRRPPARPVSPEARLALVDTMKLTAHLTFHFEDPSVGALEDLNSAVIKRINEIGVPSPVARRSDDLVYLFNADDKLRLGRSGFTAIPCAITGIVPGSGNVTTRRYICCTWGKPGNYKIRILSAFDLSSLDIRRGALSYADEHMLLTEHGRDLAEIAKQPEPEFDQALKRFIEQERQDRIVSDAIKFGSSSYYETYGNLNARENAERILDTITDFLLRQLLNNTLYRQFVTLRQDRQIKVIPGLKKPHAGGVGIYLPEGCVNRDRSYQIEQTILHEVFAKCGFTDKECKELVECYAAFVDKVSFLEENGGPHGHQKYRWERNRLYRALGGLQSNASLFEKYLSIYTKQGAPIRKLVERAMTADFSKRLDRPLYTDYNDSAETGLPQGAVDRAAREVAEYAARNRTVVLMPQTFASPDECRHVMQDFKGVEYVPYDMSRNLAMLLERYKDANVALVTLDQNTAAFNSFLGFQNRSVLKNVMPIHFSSKGVPERGEGRESFQKGVLTVTLLARALPNQKEKYIETGSYLTLKALLDGPEGYLPQGVDVEDYIANLANAVQDRNLLDRFSSIINVMLKPIIPINVEQLRHIVAVFVSA